MAKAKILSCVACALAMAVSMCSSASADLPDEHLYDRGISGAFDFDKFWIMSNTIGQFKKFDQFDLGFDNGTLWIKYWYKNEQYRDPDWWFNFTLSELVEFSDNGNGLLDAGDAIVSTVNLSGHDYSFTWIETNISWQLTAHHSSGRFDLVFMLLMRPYDFYDLNELPLPSTDNTYRQMPTEVLFRTSFFGSGGNYTNHFLALTTQTEVSHGYSLLYQQQYSLTELNITDGSESGYVRWSTYANCIANSTDQLVEVTDLVEDGNVTFVYPTNIVNNHGFVIGVNSLAPESGIQPEPDWTTDEAKAYGVGIFVSIGIIAVAIVVTIIWRRRALKNDEEVIER